VLAVAGNCDSRAIDARLAELGVALMPAIPGEWKRQLPPGGNHS
jgi:hypothetical protein